jgi:cyanophycinase
LARKQQGRLKLVANPSDTRSQRGLMIAIGGGEDKVDDRAILRTVVKRSGGGPIVLFPIASTVPEQAAEIYGTVFRAMGAEVRTVMIETREDAHDPDRVAQLDGAKVAFFTGGAQGRIVSLIGGTPLAQNIRRAHRAGMNVAGTSAGASVLCEHMIAQGRGGYAPRRNMVTMAPGLGLTKRLVLDQHFAQRHRVGRLFAAVAMNPFLIGVGVDEDTAVVIDGHGQITVTGRGTVTIVDGSSLQHTDIHDVATTAASAVLGLTVHVLTAGCGYDIDERVPRWTQSSEPPPPTRLRDARADGEPEPS